ncbi:hypothetical protein AWB68_01664 [Caballeronia choica]|uniref:Uncharacterized protein n=1 Tax=Caballeronia choica TaxID=326476 RepID=A0A158H1E7_9BURK|nr:hypothetical protein AWB68_01664 [Caballeronia choica]
MKYSEFRKWLKNQGRRVHASEGQPLPGHPQRQDDDLS